MTQKIFVVTKGNYSDYGIEGVFSNEAVAAKFALAVTDSWDKGRVEEYALDVPAEKWTLTLVRMNKNGDVSETLQECDISKNAAFVCYDINGQLTWRVRTPNIEKAIKVVSEKRQQILAANVWGNRKDTVKLFSERV